MHLPGRAFYVVASAAEHFEVCLGDIRQLAGMMLDHGEKLDRDQRHDYLRAIEQKAGHLLEMNAHLGDIAQTTLGAKSIARGRFRLSEIADQAIDALTPLAASHRRLLVLANAAGEPLIAGDYRKLLNAILSILRHCLAIAVPAAQILVSIRPVSKELRLDIDVPVETKSRASDSESRPLSENPLAAGGGLTTAVVAQIIELHGGRLDILSSESHQRFAISLPVSADPQTEIPSAN
jgi:K+-sensing histidine kinase KdpD